MATEPIASLTRRKLMKVLAATGIGTEVFRRALASRALEVTAITPEMIRQAEWVAGLELTEEERERTAAEIQRSLDDLNRLRAYELDNDVLPALSFNPSPGQRTAMEVTRNQARPMASRPLKRPDSEEELAFLTVSELSSLIRSRQLTSIELTRLYLRRLKRFDPLLKCVVNLTEEVAIEQAKRADAEIAQGIIRGPLHGIPWGAKDLIAWPGYPTTWGIPQYRDRIIDEKATVAARLEEAGAVLVAKLSLGALAMGDRWFGGRTRSPWNPRRGSSGSSAGSAAAVAAGLVGFALGSETFGSIISPSRVCGATGLRPTFGRVSRHGCMSLAWSMDKIGPIARSAEDCALVLDAIHGSDGRDPTAVDHEFTWPPRLELGRLRIGYVEDSQAPSVQQEAIRVLRGLGLELVPVELPRGLPIDSLILMLTAEAAAAFDGLTRKGITEGLNRWPDSFRQGQFIPAVEYLRASRVRSLLMQSMARLMETVDLYLASDQDLLITNLTGQPCVVVPSVFGIEDGRPAPGSVRFTGRLYDEASLLAVAHAYQEATGYHRRRPPLERYLAEDLPAH